MAHEWSAWPTSRLGWVSLILTGAVLLAWLSTPVFVQIMNSNDLDRSVGLTIVFSLLALSVVAIVIDWVSFGARKDKSVLLLIAACVISAVVLLAGVGEVIEAVMMSSVGA